MRSAAEDFDLGETVECGQLFRYERIGSTYLIGSGDRFFTVEQTGGTLVHRGISAKALVRFFRLDDDLELIRRAAEPRVRRLMQCYRGLRLVRQEPWECLISFMTSTASNIPRIRGCLRRLCERFGRPLHAFGETRHAFPRPGELGDEAALRGLGFGFRAKAIAAVSRIHDIAARLERLRAPRTSYEDARCWLMRSLPGVGPKVADCVLLFSLDHLEAFPVDVWIKRAMERLYFGGRTTTARRIHAFARERFGCYAGYYQQYIYHNQRVRYGRV